MLNKFEKQLDGLVGVVSILTVLGVLLFCTGCVSTDSDYEYTGWNKASTEAYGPFGLKPISHTLFTETKKEK